MLVPPIDKMDSSLNNLGACEYVYVMPGKVDLQFIVKA